MTPWRGWLPQRNSVVGRASSDASACISSAIPVYCALPLIREAASYVTSK